MVIIPGTVWLTKPELRQNPDEKGCVRVTQIATTDDPAEGWLTIKNLSGPNTGEHHTYSTGDFKNRFDLAAIDDVVYLGEALDALECAVKGREKIERGEQVDHPAHYGGADDLYETIKVLKAWLTPEQFVGFVKGNAIKYLSRAGRKGAAEQDHKKAAWYSEYLARLTGP